MSPLNVEHWLQMLLWCHIQKKSNFKRIPLIPDTGRRPPLKASSFHFGCPHFARFITMSYELTHCVLIVERNCCVVDEF